MGPKDLFGWQANATTLIVSLLQTPPVIAMLMAGGVLLTVVGWGHQPGARGADAGLVG